MGRISADYATATAALLPRGRVWNAGEGATNQAALVLALATLWAALDNDAEAVLDGSLPGANVDLLPEWEETLGLTNSIAGLTNSQRSAQILARFVGGGGQSQPYFIALAAALGFTITITTYAPFRAGVGTAISPVYSDDWAFAWGVHVVANTSGLSDAALLAQLQAVAPAETAVFLL